MNAPLDHLLGVLGAAGEVADGAADGAGELGDGSILVEQVRDEIGRLVSQGDFEAIVAAACLAHDIGNPPFGHFGEKAIQDWAVEALQHSTFESLTDAERADLCRFEGNAQSFRVLTRLQMRDRRGGITQHRTASEITADGQVTN